MRVLVTGDQGFVGRHLVRALVRRGDEVAGVDLRAAHSVDARDFFRADDARFDLVFHCAATVGGRATIDGDPLAVATNLSLDAELFNWAMRTRPGRVVYFSSSAAYPVDLQNDRATARPLSESDIPGGTSPIGRSDQTYGWAKVTGEMLAEHVRAAGIPVHVFRPFSGYGGDQSTDYPFPSFIDRARKRLDPFEVWGDGRQVRDWIHVDDIVRAVFAAIDQDEFGPVNLCTGIGTSFDELADLVCRVAGYSPQVKHLTDAPTGVQYRVGDPTQMLKFFTPVISLEEGVRRALA